MREIAAAAFALALALPSPLWAVGGEEATGAASKLELDYSLYAGGIPLGKVTLSARVQADQYTANSTLETVGVVNALWRARIEGTSYGAMAGEGPRPAKYDAFSIHGGPRQEMMLTYRDGMPEIFADPIDTAPDPIDGSFMQSTLDPISALVFFTTNAEKHQAKPCSLAAPVFDGRRRYDMALSFVKNDNVRMDSGLYKGPVQVCRLNFKPLAGSSQKILEGKNMPPIYGWVAQLDAGEAGKHYLVPLRVWAETPFGIVVALATRVSVNGTNLAKN